MSTLRLCATQNHKKIPTPNPKKTRTKSHVSFLSFSPFHPLHILRLYFLYDLALFHAIFSYIYFACNSFPFIFTWQKYKVLVNFYSLSQHICLGFAGDCFWVLFFVLSLVFYVRRICVFFLAQSVLVLFGGSVEGLAVAALTAKRFWHLFCGFN